jgi:hypothetical protein
MQGHIIKFHDGFGLGVIEAADGKRYRFHRSEVQNFIGEPVGHDADFLVESRRPRAIFVLAGSPWTAFGPARQA